MKYFIFLLTFLSITIFTSFHNKTEAITRVRSYYKPSTGRVVMPHYRSSPNKTRIDNYSTKGNYNPYTGKKGYKSLYK